MDLTSEQSPCESKLARKDHTTFVKHSGIIKCYQNTVCVIKYLSVHDVELEICTMKAYFITDLKECKKMSLCW